MLATMSSIGINNNLKYQKMLITDSTIPLNTLKDNKVRSSGPLLTSPKLKVLTKENKIIQ